MWIVPRPLLALSGSLATAGIISDSAESCHACAASLLVRSKRTRSRTWSRKWKRDCWTRFLCGRIVAHSHAKRFEDWWTSSSPAIRVRDSAEPVSGKVRRILASYGLSFCGQLPLFNLAACSSKTSKDTSRLDSPQCSAIWRRQVIEQRGDYSARLNVARGISASESSSWATVTAGDSITTGSAMRPSRAATNRHADYLARMVHWPTPTAHDAKNPNGAKHLAKERPHFGQLPNVVLHGFGPRTSLVQASDSTNGNRGGSLRLSADWVEALMDVPPTWTDCDCSEMECIQQPPPKHS